MKAPAIEMVHGNCLPIMASLPAGSIDLIVADPPYDLPMVGTYFAAMQRVLKPAGSIYCFGDKRHIARWWYKIFSDTFREADLVYWYYKNSPKPRGRWRLATQTIMYGYSKDSPFYEDAVRTPYEEATLKLHGRKRPSSGRFREARAYDTSKGALPRDVIEVPALTGHRARGRTGHPDEKPLELILRLMRASSKRGDIVLDPFMGSGTTLVATKALGLRGLGIEIEKKWVDVSRRRLSTTPAAG